jgi:hypothetical protein
MPNQLKEGTERVSYVESSDVHKALKIMSVYKGVSISALMRIATEDLLKKEDPSGIFLSQARMSREKQSDAPKQRARETLDPEILELAKNLQKRLAR